MDRLYLKVQLEPFKQLPKTLHWYYPKIHIVSVFKRLWWKKIIEGGFPLPFKVQEQDYHLIGSILPDPGQDAQFLYFVGEDDREANILCSKFPDLRTNIIKQLQFMSYEVNPYTKDLKTAIDKISSLESFNTCRQKKHKENTEVDFMNQRQLK